MISTILWLLFDFLSVKADVNAPSENNKQKTFTKNLYFVGILSATDEESEFFKFQFNIEKNILFYTQINFFSFYIAAA